MKRFFSFAHLWIMLIMVQVLILANCADDSIEQLPAPPPLDELPSSSSSITLAPGNVLCIINATGACVELLQSTCDQVGYEVSSCPISSRSSSSTTLSSPSTYSSSSFTYSSSSNNSQVVYNTPQYGALKACKIGSKGQICGSGSYANTAVQVRGVSLGWSNTGWEPSAFFNATTVNAMVDSWKAQIIRVPMGYSEDGGYQTDASNWTRVKTAVDAALAKGVYVIIDWHSHNAHNETSAAMTFFGTTVKEYHNVPNVIFEIYNEPESVTWATVRSYATSVISAIRNAGANNLVLVGTPSWGQNVNAPLDNPLTDTNIAYVVHFYAYSHPWSEFSAKVTAVLNAGYPVFASEYGTTHYDGGQSNVGNYDTHSDKNTDTWHDNMDLHKISSCAWNINDKYEGSAFFGISSTGRFSQTAANFSNESMMTSSGKYIYNKLRTYAGSGGGTSSSSSSGGVVAMNCLISGYCYDIGDADECKSEGGTPSTCTKMSSCNGNCKWDTGCFVIVPDPAAVYGTSPISNCTAAIKNCQDFGGFYELSNTTCANNTDYCYDCDGYESCDRIGNEYCQYRSNCRNFVSKAWCNTNGYEIYE